MDFSRYFEHPPSHSSDPNCGMKMEPQSYMQYPPPIAYPQMNCANIKAEPQGNAHDNVPPNPYYGQPIGWWPPGTNGYNNYLKCCSPYFNQFWPSHCQGQTYENHPSSTSNSGSHYETPEYTEQKFSPNSGGKIRSKVCSKAGSAKASKKHKSKADQGKNESKKNSPRKKVDRFDGLSEEEVARKHLSDHLDHNLDILIIGINPGLYAAHKGHHYAGPGNHFWKCLYMSGIVPEPYTSEDDYKMVQYKIGFTNMVARTTRGSADLSRTELKEGSEILLSKLRYYQPKIAVFNGKGIYEVFSGKKDFFFGKQPHKLEGTNIHVWVMPSSSARCAQLPRAADKVPFYVALKKLRDFLNGSITHLDESEVTFFDLKLKNQKTSPVATKVKTEIPEEN